MGELESDLDVQDLIRGLTLLSTGGGGAPSRDSTSCSLTSGPDGQ